MAPKKRGHKTKRQHIVDSRMVGREPWPGYEGAIETRMGRADRVLNDLSNAFVGCTTGMFGMEPEARVEE
jgi:hypothetical protein